MKRLFDIVIAVTMLLILMPVLLWISLVVRKQLGSPVLFRQERAGLNGSPFSMIKFRTMKNAVDADGHPESDEARLTAFGVWLRSTSLDELPELWNVLIGDMSLVGPRPLLTEYLPLYSERQNKRHLVKPGITGWVQINGRNQISWAERFELDIWYVDNRSFLLDIKILFKTVHKVLAREGVSPEGEATMHKFDGENS